MAEWSKASDLTEENVCGFEPSLVPILHFFQIFEKKETLTSFSSMGHGRPRGKKAYFMKFRCRTTF